MWFHLGPSSNVRPTWFESSLVTRTRLVDTTRNEMIQLLVCIFMIVDGEGRSLVRQLLQKSLLVKRQRTVHVIIDRLSLQVYYPE